MAISSKAVNGVEVPRGLSQGIRSFSGARAVRVIERPESSVAEHAHDWPVLSLYVMGSGTRFFDRESAEISGPCAVLHPVGEFHSSIIGAVGLEQIDIQFDPAWLRSLGTSMLQRIQHWRGGKVGNLARRLSVLWASCPSGEVALNAATVQFLQHALASKPVREPNWLRTVLEKIEIDPPPTTENLANELDLHPAWLTQAYRHATGEGLHETLMRKRVERATVLLRRCPHSAAEIAVESGFCDQSHMIRCFRRLLGRTPEAVRAECVLRN